MGEYYMKKIIVFGMSKHDETQRYFKLLNWKTENSGLKHFKTTQNKRLQSGFKWNKLLFPIWANNISRQR